MGIQKIQHEHTSVFGFEITGKLTTMEIEEFLPEMEKATSAADKKLRLLVDVTKMEGANIKSEWEIFEFMKKHLKDIQLVAIIGAHSWTKVMSEILAESVFVEAPTVYFKSEEIEHAWKWLTTAPPPKHIKVERYVHSDKGLFTKYSSPDYI
ncbi:MAG: STAS/SEC14 domain-containing protein [Candidatus Omnitrophica bacterium]|nr:STAS/SEC14 domain-containing protein [Candidatus Omnitrophota bacterium]